MEGFFKTQVDTAEIVRYLTYQSPVLLESIEKLLGTEWLS